MPDRIRLLNVDGMGGISASEYDDEGLFARDIDGQLIRIEKSTSDDFDRDVHLVIDGKPKVVKKATPLRDSQGTIIRDGNGKPIPRDTTIYDAVHQQYVVEPGDRNPIPTLCHKEHLPPVGVCRVCLVQVSRTVRGRKSSDLVPACISRVEDAMEIQTLADTNDPAACERIKRTVGTLVDMLIADHSPSHNGTAKPDPTGANELTSLAVQLGIASSTFATNPISRGRDTSSLQIAVDHDQCIVCGRCQRGCSWIKDNQVIGRTGKGYSTRIGFDLDLPMLESTCVSCGECAISCPTGALSFQPAYVQQQVDRLISEQPRGQPHDVVAAEDLLDVPLFAGIPYRFLQFNGGAVVRRQLQAGEVLCREGEYGSTAFIIVRGRFEIFLGSQRGRVQSVRARGLRGWFGGLRTFLQDGGGSAKLADVAGLSIAGQQRIIRTEEDVILGEMTCLNRYPRSATVVAIDGPAEVLEIKRNVLYMLQRNKASREVLDRVYRQRALVGVLRDLPFLHDLPDDERSAIAKKLSERVELISVDPGQTIFAQGDPADAFYVVRLGHVKVTQSYGQDERVLNYLRPGQHFGQVGILADADWLNDTADAPIATGIRTATCSSLDHVELIRIRANHFRQLVDQSPQLLEQLRREAKQLIQRDAAARQRLDESLAANFLDQGLFNAQSLLVLDLERCTRCDECTKACADTHDGVTRLVRDGLRFDKFLVASSCRSCLDPYCLVGCPVDAIHRNGQSLEIEIEDYCIGCGLCAENCPYGNINMHGFREKRQDATSKKMLPVVQMRATTCDLCRSIDGKPSCVQACPHNAAFRMTGAELFRIIERDGKATLDLAE
jgi:CRP-like cAMP-binding protein/Fe-S-cluster-containing hydrogenase component 2